MSASLARLLRVRSLLEESSRMELERRAALAVRVDLARRQERMCIRNSHDQAMKAIGEEQGQERTIAWMSAENAAQRERQLAPLAQAVEKRVEEGREEFFERRTARQQLEGLLDAEKKRLQAESDRRSQRELDDWFATKRIRQSRRRVSTES